MQSQKQPPPFEGLDLLLDPIVVVDKNYRVLFTNKKAKEIFGEPNDNQPCYRYIFGFQEPCWNYSGYVCPIKEAKSKEGKWVVSFVNYLPLKGKYVKHLIREYIHKELFLECFLPLDEIVGIVKSRFPSQGKTDNLYLSKEEFEALLNRLLEAGKRFYLIAVNIKRLKYINEIYGIAAGDLTIRAVEQAISKLTAKYAFKFTQIVGGYFLIFLDQPLDVIEKFELELLKEFKKLQVFYFGHNIKPRITITTVEIAPKNINTLKLIYKMVFYAEKVRNEKDIFHLLEPSQREVIEFLQKKEDATQKIQAFLSNDLITFHLQPIVDLKTKEVSHFEVLMRFIEDGKEVSAGKYIDLIYELGLIVDFDLKLLQRLKEKLHELQKLKRPLYINVSSEDLKLAVYRNHLKELLTSFKRANITVQLELTEQAIFQEWDFIEILAKEEGLKLVIDDFGTGYSSLKLVSDLVSQNISDTLKIDMSLTKDYFKNPYTEALVNSILAFTSLSGIKTVVEGIEREEQYQIFKGLGATYGQGWYFYKPMPLEEALKFFA